MRTATSIEIAAPTSVVWAAFSDVERWPEWTESVTSVAALDGPDLAIGNRFEIRQPRLPRLVWEVTEVDPGRSWTWVQHSAGSTAAAFHRVEAIDETRTRAHQGIEQAGPVGVVVGRLTRRMTKRYLELEARGLRDRSEARYREDTSA